MVAAAAPFAASGALQIGTVSGNVVVDERALGQLRAGWSVAGTADINLDGTSDVLVQKDDGTTKVPHDYVMYGVIVRTKKQS